MNWYYADNGKQAGPVDENQFQAMIQSGRITPETLVWKEGMANWLPWKQVSGESPSDTAAPSSTTPASAAAPSAGAATVATPGSHVTCVECRNAFPKEQCIQYGTTWVCATCKPVFVQRLQEGASMEGVFDYGGFWIRAGAKIIDSLILGVVVMIPLALVFFLLMGGNFNAGAGNQAPSAGMVALQIIIQFGSVLLVVAYNTFFVAKYAATPGKMVCGLKVVMADGSPVSGWRAFGRGWADQLSAMICYIGYIIAGFDAEKRALHDHICNTRVVRK